MVLNKFDEGIYNKIQLGDQIAFSQVFNMFYTPLCNYAFSYVRNENVAKDIVIELFINIWEKRDTNKQVLSLKAYLFRSVHNMCLNYLKKGKGVKFISSDDERIRELLLNREISGDVIEKLFVEQVKIQLEKAIQDLPEQCRKIFFLCRFENLTYNEIAKKLKISVSTVKTQMSRATIKLKTEIDNLK
jgi:RNA polymerase sigma-70 factor, ECF subfamily